MMRVNELRAAWIVALCAAAIFLFARQARARRAHSTELSARMKL